jgi:hypothetical protein
MPEGGTSQIRFKTLHEIRTNFKFGETTIPHSSEGALRLLGRNFWPSLDMKEIENEVLKQFEDVMDKISKSNVTDNIRLNMVQHFIHAFLRWHLTIYPISVSWIDLNLTRLMTQYIKKWSGIMALRSSISANNKED